MRPRIAVIGQSGRVDQDLEQAAYQVGQAIGRRGGILLSGGRDGVMAAASRGAWEVGGLTVGILPGDEVSEGNPWLTLPLTTGLTMEGRSQVLIHSSDAVIMLGGKNGTLGELSMAYMYRKPIVIVPGTGGWARRVQEVGLDEGRYLDERRLVPLRYATGPEEAVALAFALASEDNSGEQ